jgi:hypothetical protein
MTANSSTKEKSKSLIEGVSESTAACLITMVQGNILALTLGHLFVALQTGVIAGSLALAVTLLARINNKWMMSIVLGLLTMLVDFYVHPGMFGSVATEAIVTGLGAGLMSALVTGLFSLRKRAR